MQSWKRLVCALSLIVAACEADNAAPDEIGGEIDDEIAARSVEADRRITAVARAPLVVIARPGAVERVIETVLFDGQPEERELLVAEVDVVRVVAGPSQAGGRLRVKGRDSSDRAPLREGSELMLSLYPTQDGTYRIDHSFHVIDGDVPRLERTIDQAAAELEVRRAR
jgi:hypothetical protein